MPVAQLSLKKRLLLSLLVSLVIVYSIFSSQGPIDTAANAETPTPPLLQSIIPFFMNPSSNKSPSVEELATTSKSSSASSNQSPSKSTNDSTPLSLSSALNTTDWNPVTTTLDLQFIVPPTWVAKHFEEVSQEGTVKGVNITSPDSESSFFMVNVTENDNNNNQTTLSQIADSITGSIPNITRQNTTTLSGLPAYEIVSLKDMPSIERDDPALLNITDLIVVNDNNIYLVKYGAEVDDTVTFLVFKEMLDSFEIDVADATSFNNVRTNQTQAQNLTSTFEEQQQREQENLESMRSPPPVSLEELEQSQPSPHSFAPQPMQQQPPYAQQQPSVPMAPQNLYPYSQAPIISQPYPSYDQPYSLYEQLPQPQYSVPTSPVLPPQTFQPPLTTLPPIGIPLTECMGQARCFRGMVTGIRDGDTLEINGKAWRLALTNASELGSTGSTQAKLFVESVCRVGTEALVDEDDGQIVGSGDGSIGLIYCIDGIINKVSINELLLRQGLALIDEQFCGKSEFSLTAWPQQYGCFQ